MTAKGPVIIFVVDGGRSRDKRSGGGGGLRLFQTGKKGNLQIFIKKLRGASASLAKTVPQRLRYSFRVVHRPRWVKQLNSRL